MNGIIALSSIFTRMILIPKHSKSTKMSPLIQATLTRFKTPHQQTDGKDTTSSRKWTCINPAASSTAIPPKIKSATGSGTTSIGVSLGVKLGGSAKYKWPSRFTRDLSSFR
jgi:hypothetical protein